MVHHYGPRILLCAESAARRARCLCQSGPLAGPLHLSMSDCYRTLVQNGVHSGYILMVCLCSDSATRLSLSRLTNRYDGWPPPRDGPRLQVALSGPTESRVSSLPPLSPGTTCTSHTCMPGTVASSRRRGRSEDSWGGRGGAREAGVVQGPFK